MGDGYNDMHKTNQATATPAQGLGGAYCANEKQNTLRESMLDKLRRANSDSDRLNRALSILEAHPEFEDLLWLVRTGLV